MKYKKQITIAFISLFILGIISFGTTSYISAVRDPNLPDSSGNTQDIQSDQNLRISLLSIVSWLQQLLQQIQQMILQQQIQSQTSDQAQPIISNEPVDNKPDIPQESTTDSQFIGVEFKGSDWGNYANINNWKTYTNTKHNYRLKVPQDFYNKAKPKDWVSSSGDDNVSFTKNRQWYIEIRYYQGRLSLPGETDIITPSVIDWLKKNSFIPEEYNLDRPNFEIGGIPAIRTVEEGIGIFKHYRIVFIKDNKIFEVFVLADYDTENGISVEKVTEICNKILSSFEFI